MATPQIYSKGSLLVSGILIAEMMSFSVDHKNGANPINTIEKGFAGMSPGSSTTEVKCETAVPRVGVDFDYTDALNNLTLLDIVIFCRGKKLKMKGFITDVSENYGEGKAAGLSFTIMGNKTEESTL
jgi:hypothetical protein